METKTPGIVLNHLKYSDTSLVSTIYTRAYGRKAFLVQGVYRPKTKFSATFFQPLTLLDLEIIVNPQRELQRIREVSFHQPFHSLPFNVVKSSVAMFLAEILYKTLREEEPNHTVFDFLLSSIQFFDLMTDGIANFHIWFLVNFSKYLGFYPENNYSSVSKLFDPVNGRFYQPSFSNIKEEDTLVSEYLHQFLNVSPEKLETIKINHHIRYALAVTLVEYFQLHLGGLGQVKSLPVLQSVFGE